MKKLIEKAAVVAALTGSGAAFGHAGEHGALGVVETLQHFLVEHGYLVIGLALAVGASYLVRSRRS